MLGGATVTVSDAGVETAGYTVLRDGQELVVRENSIARKWRKARAITLSDGRVVLRSTAGGALAYAFPRLDDRSRPLLIISGNMLKNDRSDMELLKRFRITDWEVAEKNPACGRVLHYGWDNVLGQEK